MILGKLKYQPNNKLPNSGEISSVSPSNIALVKYWGKKPIQIPTNPSISFTLKKCYTKTSLTFKKSNSFKFDFKIDGKSDNSFIPKIKSFLARIKDFTPY